MGVSQQMSNGGSQLSPEAQCPIGVGESGRSRRHRHSDLYEREPGDELSPQTQQSSGEGARAEERQVRQPHWRNSDDGEGRRMERSE